MLSYLIVGVAVALYVLFRLWYYGLGRKASPEFIESTLLEQDDGKDLVMANLLKLKHPIAESRAKLTLYSKTFLGGALKRATHPLVLVPLLIALSASILHILFV